LKIPIIRTVANCFCMYLCKDKYVENFLTALKTRYIFEYIKAIIA